MQPLPTEIVMLGVSVVLLLVQLGVGRRYSDIRAPPPEQLFDHCSGNAD